MGILPKVYLLYIKREAALEPSPWQLPFVYFFRINSPSITLSIGINMVCIFWEGICNSTSSY